MPDRTKETTKKKLKLSSSSKNVKVRQRKQSVTWKLMMSFVNSRLLCQNCRPSIFEATTLDVIIVRRLWLQLLRLPNIMAFRSLGLTFLSHREERVLVLQGSHYKVAHGEISEFWTRHWDCCTDERSYGVFQRVVRRKCEGVQSSQCSIHQEFQVGESELSQQPLLRPGRDKNVESLRHWPWKKYSLDKFWCPWTIGTADDGDQTLDQRDYHKLCPSKTQTNRWPNPCNWGRRQLRLCRWVIRWVKRWCWCCYRQLSIIYMPRRGMCEGCLYGIHLLLNT